jgi:hypothetical protein
VVEVVLGQPGELIFKVIMVALVVVPAVAIQLALVQLVALELQVKEITVAKDTIMHLFGSLEVAVAVLVP